MQVTAEVSKIIESITCDLIFIFIELLESANSFVKMCLVLEIINVTTFIKTRFYWKQGSIEMCKHAETFHANKGYKLANVVFIQTSLFSK